MGNFLAIILTIFSGNIFASTPAVQLVMVEQEGCVYCAKFNREIAPYYAITKEGRKAPLRRVDLAEEWPEDLSAVAKDVITPTFILVHNGKETGRLHGYSGDEFFWFLLGELLEKLPP